ncbi:M23 family metallopeptidase [Helicobacter baculiformis]|uniref:M23 family metallopeptidase n=1 Tax=Helicobacter baculiformis TaxID=427351 RepID=A0ABV7ZL64_9HELI|nr:M23 family metallopeptidase [Helicobacter baculiformis]
MQDKLVLTIIDESGSKQLRLSRNVKKYLVIVALIVLISVVGGGIGLGYLVKKLGRMTLEKSIVESNYQELYHKNNMLKQDVKQKSHEIALVTSQIKNLERILRVKKGDTLNAQVYSHIDLKSLPLASKNLALALIPNGIPLATYTRKTFTPPVPNRLQAHAGYDFDAPPNTPVYASASGIVDVVLLSKQGYGNLVRLEHAFGFSSIYAHLDRIVLKPHSFVQKGQLVGYSGNNKNARAQGLHYEIRFLGQVVDMPSYLSWSLKNFDTLFTDSNINWKNLFYSIEDIAQTQDYQNVTPKLESLKDVFRVVK